MRAPRIRGSFFTGNSACGTYTFLPNVLWPSNRMWTANKFPNEDPWETFRGVPRPRQDFLQTIPGCNLLEFSWNFISSPVRGYLNHRHRFSWIETQWITLITAGFRRSLRKSSVSLADVVAQLLSMRKDYYLIDSLVLKPYVCDCRKWSWSIP